MATVEDIQLNDPQKATGRQSEIDKFVEYLRCPLTGKIFNTPIVTQDGEVFEYFEYLNQNKKDNNELIHVKSLQVFIKSFIDKYPQYKDQQYTLNDTEFIHFIHKEFIRQMIMNGNWDKLLKVKNFDMELFDGNTIVTILKNAPMEFIHYLVENAANINVRKSNNPHNDWTILHFACKYCANERLEVVDYLLNVKKGNQHIIDLKLNCPDGWTPLRQIMHYNTNPKYDWLLILAIKKYLQLGGNYLFEDKVWDGDLYKYIMRSKSKKVINSVWKNIDMTDSQNDAIANTLSYLEDNPNITKQERDELFDLFKVLRYNI